MICEFLLDQILDLVSDYGFSVFSISLGRLFLHIVKRLVSESLRLGVFTDLGKQSFVFLLLLCVMD